MESRKTPRPNFTRIAKKLTDKKRSYPNDLNQQDEHKNAQDKRHNNHAYSQSSLKQKSIKHPMQKNLLKDTNSVPQQSKVAKKQHSKPALYKPEPFTEDSSEKRGISENSHSAVGTNRSTSAWDEEIELNTRHIPEAEDFIAFEKSNVDFKYVAEEELNTPWFDPSLYPLPLSPTDRLQLEVTSLIEYLSPTPAEINVREWLCKSVELAAQSVFKTAKVEIFGSFSTKLFLPTSDVDLVVFIPEIKEVDNVSTLKLISKALCKQLKVSNLEVRAKAKVPIINFREVTSDLEVDISLNIDSGLASRAIILDFLRQCPSIRPLIMIIKHFMDLKELNIVFNGGLGSYAITLLVISFMQIHPKVRSGEIDPAANIGILLVEFFELYGPSFNPHRVGITLTNGGRYYKKISKPNSGQLRTSPLELLDPQDESNNVARGSYGFSTAQNAFKGAFTTLTQNLLLYNRHIEENSQVFYDKPILGSILYVPQSTIERRQKHKAIYHKLT